MRKPLTAAAIVLLAATPALAQPRPSFTERLKATDGTRFAVAQICLPALAAGAAPDAALFRGLVPRKPPAYPGQTSYWIGPDVTVSTDGRSCTVRATDGKAAILRETLLASLNAAAGDAQVGFDNGPDDRDGAGRFRQERHCFTLAGKPAFLLMSSSPDRGRVPLQATFGPAGDTPCMKG